MPNRIVDIPVAAARTVLDDAVPSFLRTDPQPGDRSMGGPYGFVSSGLPLPATQGAYVVDFLGSGAFGACKATVLAYMDPYGRVFDAEEPLDIPPAREPVLSFGRYEEQPDRSVEIGSVFVRDGDGTRMDVAGFRRRQDSYALVDTWYDFGSHGFDLSYEEAVARAYLAFVHRPRLGARRVPERGVDGVFSLFARHYPLRAFRLLAELARSAQEDPAFRVPPIIGRLMKWLKQAGLDDLPGDAADADLRLVRTAAYADIFYLGRDNPDSRITDRQIWALEAALNRFKLVVDELGDRAAAATDADCVRWDLFLTETVGTQEPVVCGLQEVGRGREGGEWALRSGVALAMEHLRLPYRVMTDMRSDVPAGKVALKLMVPDGSFMPEWAWEDDAMGYLLDPGAGRVGGGRGGWHMVDAAQREGQARCYAMRVGLLLACAAFRSSDGVCEVSVEAFTLPRLIGDSDDGPFEDAAATMPDAEKVEGPSCVYRATFSRELFEKTEGFVAERAGDPSPLFERCAASLEAQAPPDAQGTAPAAPGATSAAAGKMLDLAPSVFEEIRRLPSAEFRSRAPELCEGSLSSAAARSLGAYELSDLRIQSESSLRIAGERLADLLVRKKSVSEAIAVARSAEKLAGEQGDEVKLSACRRLMAGLVDGSIDRTDQNAVVSKYVGEDRCQAALSRARAVAKERPREAAGILADAVAESAALDGLVDGGGVVYRAFDSYASRVLYNVARRDRAPWSPRAAADAGASVRMVSDAYYLCHLDLVSLFEESFEHADEALRYGRRACEMAPTTLVGFRTLARAYMLTGDMESSAEVLAEGLRIATQPNDVAVAYYQLAYVLWRLGKPHAGAACYLKSMQVAPTMQVQAATELKELIDETAIVMPERDAVDRVLEREGVVLAPTDDVVGMLGAAAVAAVDEGLFPVARTVLSLYARYRPDDALTGILASLEF